MDVKINDKTIVSLYCIILFNRADEKSPFARWGMKVVKQQTERYKYKYNKHIHMKNERGIRVSEVLRNKIKRAALKDGLSMVDYLNKIVPETEITEIKRE